MVNDIHYCNACILLSEQMVVLTLHIEKIQDILRNVRYPNKCENQRYSKKQGTCNSQ